MLIISTIEKLIIILNMIKTFPKKNQYVFINPKILLEIMKLMKLSVIVPIYNKEKSIRKNLESF